MQNPKKTQPTRLRWAGKTSRDRQRNRRAIVVDGDCDYQLLLSEAIAETPWTWQINCFVSAKHAIAFLQKLEQPLDLALIELRLPDVEGTEQIKTISALHPQAAIMVISHIKSIYTFNNAVRAGALGYIIKDDDSANLTGCINQILAGYAPVSPIFTTELLRRFLNLQLEQGAPSIKLSRREMELLECIAKGYSYAAAAHAMGLQLATIHSYSRSLFKKLDVRSKSEALLFAQKHYEMWDRPLGVIQSSIQE